VEKVMNKMVKKNWKDREEKQMLMNDIICGVVTADMTAAAVYSVMQAYNEQASIGWQHFARGRMIIAWGTLINQHIAKQRKVYIQRRVLGDKVDEHKLEIYINYGIKRAKAIHQQRRNQYKDKR
jgi:hypothetical protein